MIQNCEIRTESLYIIYDWSFLSSNENLTIPTKCHQLSSSGELVQADCGDNRNRYICKIV